MVQNGRNSVVSNSTDIPQCRVCTTGGQDRTVTLTNENGDTLHQPALHGDPSMIKFFEPNGADGDVMVSIVINRRTLYLWKLSEVESPMELEFQDRYGTIVAYE